MFTPLDVKNVPFAFSVIREELFGRVVTPSGIVYFHAHGKVLVTSDVIGRLSERPNCRLQNFGGEAGTVVALFLFHCRTIVSGATRPCDGIVAGFTLTP